MADPFDVEPPRWMVLPPVDMSGMKYVGQNLGRYAAAGTKALSERKPYGVALAEVDDPFYQLKVARMNAELEEMKSKVALDRMGYLVKQHTLQQQTQADLDSARIFAETNGDPNKLLSYQYNGSNPYTIRTLAQMKLSASKDVTVQARQKQEIGWNSSLTDMVEHGDTESATVAAQIFNSVRKNGWTDENIQAYTTAWGEHNKRNPKTDKLDSFQSLIAGADEASKKSKEARAAGDEEAAKKWDDVSRLNRNRAEHLAPSPESVAKSGAARQKIREGAEVKTRFRKARSDLAKAKASYEAASEAEKKTWAPILAGAEAAFTVAKEDMNSVEGKPVESAPLIDGNLSAAGAAVGAADASATTTTTASPQGKAALANKLATEHPDWSRQQIIDEVNKQMSQ